MPVSTAAKTISFRSAVCQIRSKIERASCNGVHIYAFNVPEDQLEDAHKLLDKEKERRSIRVTYSLDHNFIIRHMPGCVHEATIRNWDIAFTDALRGLVVGPTEPGTPGCKPVGSTTFVLGPKRKQADSGVRPTGSNYPTVVLEVGSSESLGQLYLDAQLWLERTNDVNLVILISIDPPVAPNITPQITVLLCRPTAPVHPPRPGTDARSRIAQIVQNDDWTLNATPIQILLSEIFGNQIPTDYAGHTHVDLNTQWLRQEIIASYP